MSFFVPLRRSRKAVELESREPPARGELVKSKIEALHASAEDRAIDNLSAKAKAAALHNQKACSIATGSKWAEKLVFHERKLNVVIDMAQHEERHTQHLRSIADKGTREVNKVCARGRAQST